VLAKLYNLMVKFSYVPQSFGKSYTMALLKSRRSVYSKSATVDDFREISISSVLTKVLEHCILDRYSSIFVTSDNQFGSKKQSGCSHAIYMLRITIFLPDLQLTCVVDVYTAKSAPTRIHEDVFTLIDISNDSTSSNINCNC